MKGFLIKLIVVVVVLVAILFGILWFFTSMPGSTGHFVDTRKLTSEEHSAHRAMKKHIEFLADGPRKRQIDPDREQATIEYIEKELKRSGWTSKRQKIPAPGGAYYNIVARKHGTTHPSELVVIGAHWDTAAGTPGADDNASGVAGLLELSDWLANKSPERSIELVFYANEEPPFFRTEQMGSLFHARSLVKKDANVVGMLSLEMLGYYDSADGSQKYPPLLNLFYPSAGNFVAIVGRVHERDLVTGIVEKMRTQSDFPTYGFAGVEQITGIGLSDHWSYWQQGYPAVMVTDTAFFRNPHYHKRSDTPDTIDYPRAARVVVALRPVIAELAGFEFQ